MKYRKKPVVIEAFQFTAKCELPDWIKGRKDFTVLKLFREGDESPDCVSAAIETLEGTITVSKGDWIIKGVKGELYPCKADIFEATYEPVESEIKP